MGDRADEATVAATGRRAPAACHPQRVDDALPEFPPAMVAILATVGPAGPVAIPVSAVVRHGPRALLLGLAARRGSLVRLRHDPRVALSLSGPGFSLAVEGEAAVAADPLPGVERVVAVAVRATGIRDVRGASTEVDAGMLWRWTDDASDARHRAVMAALGRLAAGTIV